MIEQIDEEIYVSPGFIDSHVHVFGLNNPKGIPSVTADSVGIKQGVTTVVDAGSCGIANFAKLKNQVYDENLTKVKFFINVSKYGLQEGLSELADINNLMSLEELIEFKNNYGENLVGIKVRMSASVVKQSGLVPLEHARKLASQVKLPLMVHIGNGPPALGDILDLLEKDDIVTHFLHGKAGGILDFKENYRNAIKRGVYFDVGHGSSSFCFKTAQKILDIEKIPFSISTDIYAKNIDKPVGSLMETMSKFLGLGYSLKDVVESVTSIPEKMLNISTLGTKTFFKLEKIETKLVDSENHHIKVDKILRPYAVEIDEKYQEIG